MIAASDRADQATRQGGRVRLLVGVLLGAILLAGLAIAVHSGDTLRYPDEHDYHALALSLVSGHGYVGPDAAPTAYRAPGFPAFLACVYRLSARPLAAKVANAILLLLTALLVYGLARQLAPGTAWLGPLLVLCYPVMIYTSSTLYPQTLGTTLLAGVVWLVVWAPASLSAIAAAGLLGGALVLVIPSFEALLPLPALFVGFLNRAAPARAWRRALLFVACAALVIAPWTWRNHRVFGAWVPVATNSGINLLLGNSDNARPNSGVNVDLSAYSARAAGLGEVELDRYYGACARAWIRQHPVRAARLYAAKWLNYFNFRNELNTAAEASRMREALAFATYYPLLLLAALRLFWWRRYRLKPAEVLLYALYVGNAFPSALFFTRIRFRLPCDALLIVLAVAGLGVLAAEWKRRTQLARS